MLDFPLGRWVQPALPQWWWSTNHPKKMWLGFFFWGLGVVAGSLLGYWTDWIPRPMVRPSVRLPFILYVVGAIVFALIYVNILLEETSFPPVWAPYPSSGIWCVRFSLLSRFYYIYHLLLWFFQCELFYELNLTQSAYSFYYFKILKLIHFCLLLELLKLF